MIINKKTGLYCLLFLSGCIGFCSRGIGQKKLLSYDTGKDWPSLGYQALSNNGRYLAYQVDSSQGHSLFIESADGKWKQEIKNGFHGQFSENSGCFVFQSGDYSQPVKSLGIIKPGNNSIQQIDSVSYYLLSKKTNWLAYAHTGNKLTLSDLSTGQEYDFENFTPSDYANGQFSESGAWFAWTETVNKQCLVRLMNVTDRKIYNVCTAGSNTKLVINGEGNRLAIVSDDNVNGKLQRVARYFNAGSMDSAKLITTGNNANFDGYTFDDRPAIFSRDGHHLYLFLKKSMTVPGLPAASSISSVKVFGNGGVIYNALVGKTIIPRILAAIELADPVSTPVVLTKRNEGETNIQISSDKESGDYILINDDVIREDGNLSAMDTAYRTNIYLVSCKDGQRKLLIRRATVSSLSFSPEGKYIKWYDQVKKQWMVYSIALSKTIVVSTRISEPLNDTDYDRPSLSAPASSDVGWLKGDGAMLIPTAYDIWQVDPEGKKGPVNLTGSYGKSHHIVFRIAGWNNRVSLNLQVPDAGGRLLLSALNEDTKDMGYFIADLSAGKLQQLVLSSHVYSDFVKARDADIYFFKRESATEYPDYYVTNDFKNVLPLTDIHPQKEYNWYTKELVKWKLPDGKMDEGVLYKPENLDPSKKYPLIFYYYEGISPKRLNSFHSAGYLCDANIEHCIPWYVSNGYLVFIPAIHYRPSHPGQSACDAVVSAANYLSKRSYVDGKHMGLQGHSFGGFETNYIVSHSTLFAAAAPAAGVSNLIEAYGDVYTPSFCEVGQQRIGYTLWQRPDLYIENSAVMHADKITTPLLIMHGKHDNTVPYNNAWQWYQDLQRLNKKVWLLTYDADHELGEQGDALDYTLRMRQFFDYYLKGLPPPVWMTHPLITPEMIKSGADLKLDASGARP